MLVALPSGALAPLDVPSLPSLLAAGGDVTCIAAASFAHEEVAPADLRDADAYFIAVWALDEFAATDAGLELAIVADGWHLRPSALIGLADLPLAWELDRTLYVRLQAAKEGEGEPDMGDAGDPESRVRFSTAEVET